jgi:hypothetical protein
MSLLPIYEGGRDWRAMTARLEAAGFSLHLVLPGYFERKLGRMLEIDGVFMREAAPDRRSAAKSGVSASRRPRTPG